MGRLSLVTPPSIEPVTLAEAKAYCKIDVTDDDTLVTDLIAAARKAAEEHLNRSLITQTWDYFLDAFPPTCVPICLPRGPVQSVATVKYTPNGASIVTVSSSDYYADITYNARGEPKPAEIFPVIGKMWPGDLLRVANGVEVRYTAGYGAAAANVPEHIRTRIKQVISLWYYNRTVQAVVNDEVRGILGGALNAFVYA